MDKPTLEYFKENTARLNRLSLQKAYPEYYEYLKNKYPGATKTSEMIWLDLVGCTGVCQVCGKSTKFLDFTSGYRPYCSRKCLGIGTVASALKTKKERYSKGEIAAKVAKTKTERYGDPNFNNVQKNKQTCLRRYGMTCGGQTKEAKQKRNKTKTERYGDPNFNNRSKASQTCTERYGVGNVSQIPNIQQRKENTFQLHYGARNIFCSDSFIKTNRNKTQNRATEAHDFLIGHTESGDWICRCPHAECTKCDERYYITRSQIYRDRVKSKSELCTRILPIGQTPYSSFELFVRQILDENNIEYISNDRTILHGQELDIYIPTLNIAIECNGCYWHQTNELLSHSKPKTYHINKYKKCLDKGIRLITLWDDWFYNNEDLLKSMLLAKLGRCDTRVFARKCTIKEINSTLANNFFEHNHIQGACRAQYYVALYYNDEIVAAMSFGQRKGVVNRNNICEWELIRFCNKVNTRVVGGAERLLRYFTRQYQPKSIVSFSSNDISDGNMYKVLGFIKSDNIQQSYWYVDANTTRRYHRSTFTKQAIAKRFGAHKGTEYEIMNTKPYFRIYDTGTTKWQLIL